MGGSGLEKGTTIGPYVVLGEMASGGMATVYVARHGRLGHVVALKILHPHFQKDESLRIRFVDEARIQANLRHPNILTVQDILELPEASGMVMELLDGCTLSAYYRKVSKPLPAGRALWVFIKLADALSHAHSLGIVHRDLKPSNVYLHRLGTDAVPKLMDFGIAKLKNMPSEGQMTAAGSMLGTPQYMAPEQFEDSSRVDYRADVYAIGVMLYDACTGVLPFEGDGITQIMRDVLTRTPTAPRKLVPEVSPLLEDVILRCLLKDREQRFQSAEALRTALEQVAVAVGTEAIPAGTVPAADLKSKGIEVRGDITSARRSSTTVDLDALARRPTDTAIPVVTEVENACTEVTRPTRGLTAGLVVTLLLLAAAAGGYYAWWGGEEGGEADPASPSSPPIQPAGLPPEGGDERGDQRSTSLPWPPRAAAPEALGPGQPSPPNAEADHRKELLAWSPVSSLPSGGSRPSEARGDEGVAGLALPSLPTAEGLALGKACEGAAVGEDVVRYMNARLVAGWHGRRLSYVPDDQLGAYGITPRDLEHFKTLITTDPLLKELATLSSRAVSAFKDGPLARSHLARVQLAIDRDSQAKAYLEAKEILLCDGRLATLRGETDLAGSMLGQVLAEKKLDSATFNRLDAQWEGDALLRAELYSRALCCLVSKAMPD